MQKVLHQDNQESSEGPLHPELIRSIPLSQQPFPAPPEHQESERSAGSPTGMKEILRSVGYGHDPTILSSDPHDTSTNGTSQAHCSRLPKQVFPWMKETRHNNQQKGSLPVSDSTSPHSSPPPKRVRTAYTHTQLVELEKEFHFNRYLCRPRRMEMARLLRLSERQIKIWFQNRRMKYKKDSRVARKVQSKSRPGGDCASLMGATYQAATASSFSKAHGGINGTEAYADSFIENTFPSISLEYSPLSGAGEEDRHYGPPVLQGSPSETPTTTGENDLGNVPEACSLLSFPDCSLANLDYSCATELPGHHPLGLSNPPPIYADVSTHPVPQGDSQGPVNLMHL